MMSKKVVIAVVLCLFIAVPVFAQQRGTPTEAKMLVEQAVAFAKANGEEMAIKEFDNPKGKFVKYDLYVFAYDLKGVMKGHPNPKLIGQSLYNQPDSKGKLFRKEIVDNANSQGSGWVDYTYMNPAVKKEEAKITYFQKVGNLIVCCGAYLP